MTEMQLIIDLHKHTERQGPGSVSDTLRALDLMNLPNGQTLKIADIGCGTGGQTLTLVQHLDAEITAVDLFPEFLEELKSNAKKLGLKSRIKTLDASMDNLPFHPGKFDIIWSEGAIYNIGFERGIKLWKKYLKEGGYLAVSEITWITAERPNEIETFWTAEYPEIDTASNKIRLLENNGYTLAGYFYLSRESWMDHYYKPLEAGFDSFLQRNGNTELAKKVIADTKAEIELYRKFGASYSYGFYIARKAF